MTSGKRRRAQRTSGPRPSTGLQRGTGLKLLILIAVVGLVLVSMASFGGVSPPAPTASPFL